MLPFVILKTDNHPLLLESAYCFYSVNLILVTLLPFHLIQHTSPHHFSFSLSPICFTDLLLHSLLAFSRLPYETLVFRDAVIVFDVGLSGFLPIHPRTILKSKRNRAAAAKKQAELDEQKSDSPDSDSESEQS